MKKILLVHHRPSFLDRNRSLLNRAGCLIFTAASAKQALQITREQPVDLIISLLDMPEMGGDELCILLRRGEGLAAVPFILVSYGSEAELERASRSGADASLTKPVRPELLLEQVEKILHTPAHREYRASFHGRVRDRGENTACNMSASGIPCESATHFIRDDLITDLLFAMDAHEIDCGKGNAR